VQFDIRDHLHLVPPFPLTISEAMKSVKLASPNTLGRLCGGTGEQWQPRATDRPRGPHNREVRPHSLGGRPLVPVCGQTRKQHSFGYQHK